MPWTCGAMHKSSLRVWEVQSSMPVQGALFINLPCMIETYCEIKWHFQFIYRVCSYHSTLGKAPVPGSTSRQHQQAAPWAAPAAPWSLWPPASSCIPKHWRTYLCFHSETDSSNNCGYVVLNQWLRLRKGVKDTLRNSHHRVASKTRTWANIPAVSWLKGDRGVLYWNTR